MYWDMYTCTKAAVVGIVYSLINKITRASEMAPDGFLIGAVIIAFFSTTMDDLAMMLVYLPIPITKNMER